MADGFELFTDRSIVAMRVNGELRDLAAEVTDADTVEPIAIDSPDGLNILRHSAAHVLAQAVQRINPQTTLGIGPPITDGFYYDFNPAEPFTPDDLKAISSEMQKIVKQGQRFVRRVVTEDEARAELASSAMWAANAATVSPSADCADGRLHASVANLQTMLHRILEAEQTERTLRRLMPARMPSSASTPLMTPDWLSNISPHTTVVTLMDTATGSR